MPWISNRKHKIKEKSTKISQSSSKIVGLGPVDLWEIQHWCWVKNEDVFGAALTTTSEWSTSLLPSKLRLTLEICQ